MDFRPYGNTRYGLQHTVKHGPIGLITQRSLVQIQPAQRSRKAQVSGGVGAIRRPFCIFCKRIRPGPDEEDERVDIRDIEDRPYGERPQMRPSGD